MLAWASLIRHHSPKAELAVQVPREPTQLPRCAATTRNLKHLGQHTHDGDPCGETRQHNNLYAREPRWPPARGCQLRPPIRLPKNKTWITTKTMISRRNTSMMGASMHLPRHCAAQRTLTIRLPLGSHSGPTQT